MKNFTLLLLVLSVLMSACSMEKRLYRKGYNVQWHASLKSKNQLPESNSNEVNTALVEKDKSQQLVKETENAPIQAPLSITTTVPTQDVASVQINPTQMPSIPMQNHFVKHESSKASVHSGIVDHSKEKRLVKHIEKMKHAQDYSDDVPVLLLFLLCFIIPPVAVGLATDWDVETVIYNIIWCVLCGLPGVIHALIVVSRNR
jgi:uncharacterized membrane protein YqaE (UPF0057 family)